MPAFIYEAYTASGEHSSGTLMAADHGEAVRKLTRQGLQPFALRSQDEPGAAAAARPNKDAASGGSVAPGMNLGDRPEGIKLSRQQVIRFTEELCDLLSAGLQLAQALHAMENRSHHLLRALATQLREKIQDGVPFSTALRETSPSFGDLYCNLAAAGEAGGALPSILKRQTRYLNQMESLRSKVTGALIYPFFIVLSGVALAVVFLTYLLPKLAILIQSTSNRLPSAVRWLLATSDFLKTWWWLILAFLLALMIVAFVLLQNPKNQLLWHRISLRLPIFGPVLRTRFEVQFLETLGNLLKNGLPLHRALELVRKAMTNQYLRAKLTIMENDVHDGTSLSRALEKSNTVRPLVVDMVRVGEQTGEMADALERAADRFDSQFSQTLERATALLQPVIMLVMAGMVGGMAWMMINIVFSTLQQVNQR